MGTRLMWSIAVQMRYLLSRPPDLPYLCTQWGIPQGFSLPLTSLAPHGFVYHTSFWPDRPPDAFNTFTPHVAKASAMPSIHPTPAVF